MSIFDCDALLNADVKAVAQAALTGQCGVMPHSCMTEQPRDFASVASDDAHEIMARLMPQSLGLEPPLPPEALEVVREAGIRARAAHAERQRKWADLRGNFHVLTLCVRCAAEQLERLGQACNTGDEFQALAAIFDEQFKWLEANGASMELMPSEDFLTTTVAANRCHISYIEDEPGRESVRVEFMFARETDQIVFKTAFGGL